MKLGQSNLGRPAIMLPSAHRSLGNVFAVASCVAPTARLCGEQVGRQMAVPIRAAVQDSLAGLGAFLATAAGRRTRDDLVSMNRAAYPEVAEEYIGLAAGAGISHQDMLTVALENELVAFAKQEGLASSADRGAAFAHRPHAPSPMPRAPKSCTDYHLMAGAHRMWGHNEDAQPIEANRTYLVEARVGGFGWVGFAYAPHVVGWAYGINTHGLGQSINALSPLNVTLGAGINFLARDVLNAASLDDAATRACAAPAASGQNLNVGSVHEPGRQLLIETSPVGCSVRELKPPPTGLERADRAIGSPTLGASAGGRSRERRGTLVHCNLYESTELAGLDGGPAHQPSSAHRLARLRSLPPATTAAELRARLDDRVDAAWPVHRNAVRPGSCMTLNTAVFDTVARTLTCWGPNGPQEGKPVRTYNWSSLEPVVVAVAARQEIDLE